MQKKQEKIPGHKSRWYRLELTFPQLLNPFEDLHALHEIILSHLPGLLIEYLLLLHIISLRHVEIRVDYIVSVAGKGFAERRRELIMIDALAEGGGDLRREVTVHQEAGFYGLCHQLPRRIRRARPRYLCEPRSFCHLATWWMREGGSANWLSRVTRFGRRIDSNICLLDVVSVSPSKRVTVRDM